MVFYMFYLNMVMVNAKKDGRFFCDMNKERWGIILQNITSATLIQNWQSQDRRIEKQDIWFNSI